MIDRKRLLALDYYKKEHFSGSDSEKNMRYRIERIVPEEETATPLFRATLWPEPYSYECTDPSLFITHEEDFSEEGLRALVEWMNLQDFTSAYTFGLHKPDSVGDIE